MNSFIFKKRIFLIYFLSFLGFGIILISLFFLLQKTTIKNINEVLNNEAKEMISFKKNRFNNTIEHAHKTLLSIKNNELFIDFLSNKNSDKKVINKTFLQILNANSDFLQLRFLDNFGNEIIRVDKSLNSENGKIILDEELQNKKNRYYFYETLKINKDELYISNLDLNMENEKIEFPYNPTLRISIPIYNNLDILGVLVVNLNMNEILKDLTYSKIFDFIVADNSGNILYDSNKNLIFSKYIEKNKDFNLYKIYNTNIDDLIVEKNKTFFIDELYEKKYNKKESLYLLVKASDKVKTKKENQENKELFYLIFILLVLVFPLASIASIYPTIIRNKLDITMDNLEETLDTIDKYVLMSKTDKNRIITQTSSAMEKLTGYKKEELIGQKHSIFQSYKNDKKIYNEMLKALRAGNSWSGEIINKKKNGDYYWLRTTIIPYYNNNNELSGYKSFSIDITDKKKLEELSQTDTLTQLYNRRKLDEILKNEIIRSKRYKNSFSVIIADIDKFKSINDTYGHQIGDIVLKEFAKILKNNIRESDFVGRWGGEEFLIIATNTNIDSAFKLAENLRKIIEETKFDKIPNITSSFGVSSYTNGDNENSIIYKADIALYKAKEQGRNRVLKSQS